MFACTAVYGWQEQCVTCGVPELVQVWFGLVWFGLVGDRVCGLCAHSSRSTTDTFACEGESGLGLRADGLRALLLAAARARRRRQVAQWLGHLPQS